MGTAITDCGTSLAALAQRIDDLFVRQSSRFAFHHDETENDYRVQESRLSSLMLDKSVSDEKHLECAQAIGNRAERYRQDFIAPLQKLTDEIGQELVNFEQVLQTSVQANNRNDLERWLALSRQLHEARQLAVQSIESRTHFETYVPNIIIQNNGRTDITLTAEQSKEFTEGISAYAALMKASHEANQRIQQEREPLTKLLFPIQESAKPRSAATSAKTAITVHPLEGKSWFRLLKVIYVGSWILGLGASAVIAYAMQQFVVFVIGGSVIVVGLVGLKKLFYYVVLGRTTATEQPGKGFVDLEDFRNNLAGVKANSPDVYEQVVAPFFQSWKERYGRRVPLHETEVLQKRIDRELNQLREKKQEIIDRAAKKGATIELAALRKNIEKSKTEYAGPNREAYVRQLDAFLTSLEVKYGTSVPVDEANKLLDKLDDEIRAAGETPGG